MAFTEKDKQGLIELVNNIQHTYSPGRAPAPADPANITLPCRLLRSAAAVTEQVYQPEVLGRLDESEVELLLTYLSKAVDAVAGVLGQVVAALPQRPPEAMTAKLVAQADSLEALKRERETPATAGQAAAHEGEAPAARQPPEEPQGRQQALLLAEEGLGGLSLEELARRASEAEVKLEPARTELELLQRQVADKERELDALDEAIAAARRRLGAQEKRSEEQFAALASLGEDLLAALNPYLARFQRSIQSAAREIAEKIAEGKRLRQELRGHVEEVGKLYEETAELSGVLRLYAEANRHVARNIPTVLNATRERLRRIEEELREVDGELKRALVQQQSAGRVADKVGQ